jgi:hypothetical protein
LGIWIYCSYLSNVTRIRCVLNTLQAKYREADRCLPELGCEELGDERYMLPVAMGVFRGRFVHGFDKPGPLVPGKPEEFVINLHQINHVFKKGHRIMIQVQSTWFPIIDRSQSAEVCGEYFSGGRWGFYQGGK